MKGSVSVAVVGASGFAGAELLRLVAVHPELEIRHIAAGSNAGEKVKDLYPNLAPVYGDRKFETFDPNALKGHDLVFFAMPHGVAMEAVPRVASTVGRIVDLSADFRLKDPLAYDRWYGFTHRAPELLASTAFGIPELYRDEISSSALIAAAGCYVTAAALALAPLKRSGLVEKKGTVVDAASGVSGAGRSSSPDKHFALVDEDFSAYGLLAHRHTPEIEQATEMEILFTPHLAPMSRGILATCYARPTEGTTGADLEKAMRVFAEKEPFVHWVDGSPSTKAASGSNNAFVSCCLDERTGWVLAIASLDNLVKGAAGQAVQCANIALGFDETIGLPITGQYP